MHSVAGESFSAEIAALLDAAEDAVELCERLGITPTEVEELREIVPRGAEGAFRELLSAARERAVKSGNAFAAQVLPRRDANATANSADYASLSLFSAEEIERIARLDALTAATLGAGVLDRTRNNEIVPFSAMTLVRSLITLGMPSHVGLRVADAVPSHLQRSAKTKALLDTADVRLAVLAAIEELAGQAASRKAFGDLLALYAERYGSPAKPIRVVDDKRHTVLSYRLVADHVIGDVVSKHLAEQWDCFGAHSLLRRSDVDAMSVYLVEQVKRLQMTELRYSTLVELAWDTGVSKKQPWFVRHPDENSATLEAIDRARGILKELESTIHGAATREFNTGAISALREASSAVLYRVGAAVGPAPRTPVSSVAHLLCSLEGSPRQESAKYSGPGRLARLVKSRGIAAKALGERIFWARKWTEGRKTSSLDISGFRDVVRDLLHIAER